jgi:predicted porin
MLTYPSCTDLQQTFSIEDKSMKKSLIVLAVLGTFAGTASAQTALTIYGLVDAGIVRESGGPNGSTTKLTGGVQNGSRLGFKGAEDLGGGLAAKFVLESGFDTSSGQSGQGGRLFGRQAYVGLGGNWGNVTLGRQYTPHYLAIADIDPFGVGLAGNALNLIPTVQRTDNTIKYTTPTWSGFVGDLAYAFGEQAGNNSAARQYGVSVGYANGPLVVKLAHQRANGPAVAPDTLTGFPGGIAPGDRSRNTFLGGKWDFGVAAASLAYNTNKGGIVAPDTRDWLLGVSVPYGAGTFLASYIRSNDRTATDADAHQWALGYTHAVSKRTNFYASWARISNDRDLTYRVGNATDTGGPVPPGQTNPAGFATGDKAFNIGVRHLF